jgi:hypothetical protein
MPLAISPNFKVCTPNTNVDHSVRDIFSFILLDIDAAMTVFIKIIFQVALYATCLTASCAIHTLCKRERQTERCLRIPHSKNKEPIQYLRTLSRNNTWCLAIHGYSAQLVLLPIGSGSSSQDIPCDPFAKIFPSHVRMNHLDDDFR